MYSTELLKNLLPVLSKWNCWLKMQFHVHPVCMFSSRVVTYRYIYFNFLILENSWEPVEGGLNWNLRDLGSITDLGTESSKCNCIANSKYHLTVTVQQKCFPHRVIHQLAVLHTCLFTPSLGNYSKGRKQQWALERGIKSSITFYSKVSPNIMGQTVKFSFFWRGNLRIQVNVNNPGL